MWLRHLSNLGSESWSLMMGATGTNTLGFFVWTLALSIMGWLATVGDAALRNYRASVARPVMTAVRDSWFVGCLILGGVVILVTLCWGTATLVAVYRDHNRLAAEIKSTNARNVFLSAELEKRRHSVSTQDPVFPNLIYLLQAFRMYRAKMGQESCVIKVTAPKETEALASVFAQLSNATSNCAVFGPMTSLATIDPDIEKDAAEEMVSDAIVLHAAKDDAAANELFMRLGNQIKLVRSYKIPKQNWANPPDGPYKHVIWLQFGDKVRWNSETFQ